MVELDRVQLACATPERQCLEAMRGVITLPLCMLVHGRVAKCVFPPPDSHWLRSFLPRSHLLFDVGAWVNHGLGLDDVRHRWRPVGELSLGERIEIPMFTTIVLLPKTPLALVLVLGISCGHCGTVWWRAGALHCGAIWGV